MALQAGLGFRLSRLARTLRRSWTDQLSGIGLSPPQAAVLRGVAEEPGCSLRSLARLLGADPMNVKRCVDELEQRGLIRSGSRPGDRRPRTLTLSENGITLARDLDALVVDQETWLNKALGPIQRVYLESSLSTLEALVGLDGGAPKPAAPTTNPRGTDTS